MKIPEISLVLEKEDLLNYNERTHDIVVDKYIFDDFHEGKIIGIHFVDDETIVREYEMISEDDNGIYMSYICEYED